MGSIEEAEVVESTQQPLHPQPSEPTPADITAAIESYSISQSTPSNSSSNGPVVGPAPQVPQTIAAFANKSSEEIISELNKTPLFMTELEQNDELEAFKALAYDGTPSENAQNFKEHGNEVFKQRKWVDAKEFYTKAISLLQIEERKRSRAQASKEKAAATPLEESKDSEEEVKTQRAILEACLGNRSACHVQLKNYRSATLDCAGVLRLNPSNVKAYYRSGVALLALDKILEADDACARGLALDTTHKDLLKLAQDIIKRSTEIQDRNRKEAEAEARRKQEVFVKRVAIKARNIRTRKTAQPPEMEDACIRLVPDPADPTSSLVFPTVLLYPLHLQSDFIKEFGETEKLGERLDYILAERLVWDEQGEYSPKGVECYMETVTGGLVKVGRGVTLLKVLSAGNVEVVDEVVKIFVVPKAKAAGWVEEFKRKKAAEKGGS
jgi:hypothetical protein